MLEYNNFGLHFFFISTVLNWRKWGMIVMGLDLRFEQSRDLEAREDGFSFSQCGSAEHICRLPAVDIVN
jgi:hypothetical protein